MADSHKNFSYSTVSAAPSPANSGSSLTVVDGSLFPTPPFNATVWPVGVTPISTNAEIVRVTGVAGNVFTISRAQESSTARAIIVGDQIAATITAKTLTDVESQDVFNEIPSGLINGVNDTFTSAFNFRSGSVRVYLNGIKEKYHSISGSNTIIMDDPPLTNDLIEIDYIKL